MDERRANDPIDGLVSGYLAGESAGVDAGALLARARRSRRLRRTRRRAAAFALAAGVLVGVTVFLLRPEPKPAPGADPAAQQVEQQEQRVADAMSGKAAVGTAPTPATPDTATLAPALADARESLAADAQFMTGKVREFVSFSLERAGLVL